MSVAILGKFEELQKHRARDGIPYISSSPQLFITDRSQADFCCSSSPVLVIAVHIQSFVHLLFYLQFYSNVNVTGLRYIFERAVCSGYCASLTSTAVNL